MPVTLDPTARRQNVQASWHVYVDAQFSATFPGAIDYGDPTFDESGKAEWLVPHLLVATGVFGRHVNLTDRAQRVIYMPQVNIFLRPRGVNGETPANAYRLHALRDIADAALREGVVISVVDHAGASTALGVLIVRRTTLDQEVPALVGATEDVRQWSYGVEADWVELYQP